jgi:hypothetical protein
MVASGSDWVSLAERVSATTTIIFPVLRDTQAESRQKLEFGDRSR